MEKILPPEVLLEMTQSIHAGAIRLMAARPKLTAQQASRLSYDAYFESTWRVDELRCKVERHAR